LWVRDKRNNPPAPRGTCFGERAERQTDGSKGAYAVIVPCDLPPSANDRDPTSNHAELLAANPQARVDVRRPALDQLFCRLLRDELTDADRAIIANEPPVQNLLVLVAMRGGV
jgi:hypothetical protein